MKIKIGKSETCVTLSFDGPEFSARFYMTFEELARVAVKHPFACFDDCGNVLQVRSDAVAYYESAGNNTRNEGGTVRYLRCAVDASRFFTTVRTLIDKGIVSDNKGATVDTRSFAFKREEQVEMTFSAILKHGLFDARAKLYEALRDEVPAEEFMKLRGIFSRLISQGKMIVADLSKSCFYFYQAEGQGYNGGVIYHRGGKSYSVHT